MQLAQAEQVVRNPEDMRGIDTALLTLIQDLQKRLADMEGEILRLRMRPAARATNSVADNRGSAMASDDGGRTLEAPKQKSGSC